MNDTNETSIIQDILLQRSPSSKPNEEFTYEDNYSDAIPDDYSKSIEVLWNAEFTFDEWLELLANDIINSLTVFFNSGVSIYPQTLDYLDTSLLGDMDIAYNEDYWGLSKLLFEVKADMLNSAVDTMFNALSTGCGITIRPPDNVFNATEAINIFLIILNCILFSSEYFNNSKKNDDLSIIGLLSYNGLESWTVKIIESVNGQLIPLLADTYTKYKTIE